MRKYQTEFKLKVVKSFLDGDGGAKLLARQCQPTGNGLLGIAAE
jgi:transposase-like protein